MRYKRSRFSSAPRNSGRLSSPPIIYHLLTTKKQIMSQYFSNNTNILNTINMSNTFIVAGDRSNILSWFSPLDPKLRHQGIRDCRVKNVGEWFYKPRSLEASIKIVGKVNPVVQSYFFHGDPGAGKTFIRSQEQFSRKGKKSKC